MSDCVIWKRRRRIVGELGVKQMGRAKDTRGQDKLLTVGRTV